MINFIPGLNCIFHWELSYTSTGRNNSLPHNSILASLKLDISHSISHSYWQQVAWAAYARDSLVFGRDALMNWSLSIFPSELLLYLKFCLTACKGSVLTNQLHNRVIARTSQSVCELIDMGNFIGTLQSQITCGWIPGLISTKSSSTFISPSTWCKSYLVFLWIDSIRHNAEKNYISPTIIAEASTTEWQQTNHYRAGKWHNLLWA